MVLVRRSAPLTVAALLAAVLGCSVPEGGSVDPSPSGRPDPTAASPDPTAASPVPSAPPSTGDATPRPEPTAPVIPTLRPPTGPPKKPTDPHPRDRIAGLVTKGGTGPCYGLVTDDGKEYALHSTEGIELVEGTYVRVTVAPLLLKIYCGPGQHMALIDARRVG